MTTITITINWPAIHAAIAAVDRARVDARCKLGRIGAADVFGGAYYPSHYESQGLAGLVRLSGALDRLADEAWQIVHAASRVADGAVPLAAGPTMIAWWSRVDNVERRHPTRRAARDYARRHGGTWQRRDVPPHASEAMREAARAPVIERARLATRVAIAVARAKALLAETGVRKHPENEIAGTGGGYGLCGLGWLAGWPCEPHGSVTSAMVEEFAAHGVLPVRRAS